MSTVVFSGNSQQYVYQAQTVPQDTHASIVLNFLTTTVTWTGSQPPGVSIPDTIRGATLGQLLVSPTYKVTTKMNVQVTGSQFTLSGEDTAVTSGNFSRDNQDIQKFNYVAGGSGSTRVYNINLDYTVPVPDKIDLYLHNECVDFFSRERKACASLAQYPANSYTFLVTINVTLTVSCSGNGLADQVCVDFCKGNASCLQAHIDYCFGPEGRIGEVDTSGQSTGDSQLCTNYFNSYLTNPSLGLEEKIDTAFNTYCVRKYKDLQGLLQSNDVLGKQLCACNMNQSDYDQRYATLAQVIPNIEILNLNRRCIVNQCTGSPFKNSATGKVCTVPRCLNLAQINNNGSIKDSKLVVTQTGECVGLDVRTGPISPTGPVGPISPTGPVGPISPTGPVGPIQPEQPIPSQPTTNVNNIFLWTGGGIIVILVIVFLILLFTRR